MMRCAVLAAALAGLSGCTVSAVDAADDPRPSNTCSADDECASGSCRASVCQTLDGELETLLLEVTPPTDSELPHLSMVAHVADVPTAGGDKTFTIARPAHVTGSLLVDPENSDCYPTLPEEEGRLLPEGADGSLPLAVTFAPREQLLGLPQQLYVTTAKGSEKDFSYRFDLHVPAGEYDVYVVPPKGQTNCVVPPQLYRSQLVSGEVAFNPKVVVSQAVTLEAVCEPDARLDSTVCLYVRWPRASQSLDGWVADIIEPLGGRPISTEFVLGSPDGPEGSATVEYKVPLIYSTVDEPPAAKIEAATDLVRLRPPAGVVAPTILLDRSALGLFATYSAVLDSFTQVPEPVRVEGQVASRSDGQPAEGYVTLVSTEITGVDAGIFASFQASVQVGSDGVFRVDLPPGKYRVHAVPPMEGGAGSAPGALSALVTDWDVPAGIPFQAGKLLELPSITSITGQSSFPGAQVQVQATPQSVLPFEEAFGAAAFVPRATSGLVDDRGRFEVQVDPGQFDISVRAPDELGFGWFVRPGVEVVDARQDLGRMEPKEPSVLTGIALLEVTANSSIVVPSALVRAYAYLDVDRAYTRDPTRAVSVIQVAETRTDEAGAFRLLLPSSIAAP